MIGDSTFFHSGIPPIINLIKQNVSISVLILDNYFCAMTGDQLSPSTPQDFRRDNKKSIQIEPILSALGDFQIRHLDGYSIKRMTQQFINEFPKPGVKFFIVKAECALNKKRRLNEHPIKIEKDSEMYIHISEHCVKCNECFERLGCTAIQENDNQYIIDSTRCMGENCQSCIEICPNHAIYRTIVNPHLRKNKKEKSET
jgi:indolepyruvate ferredoxin oxidoreductase alpha subunit